MGFLSHSRYKGSSKNSWKRCIYIKKNYAWVSGNFHTKTGLSCNSISHKLFGSTVAFATCVTLRKTFSIPEISGVKFRFETVWPVSTHDAGTTAHPHTSGWNWIPCQGALRPPPRSGISGRTQDSAYGGTRGWDLLQPRGRYRQLDRKGKRHGQSLEESTCAFLLLLLYHKELHGTHSSLSNGNALQCFCPWNLRHSEAKICSGR